MELKKHLNKARNFLKIVDKIDIRIPVFILMIIILIPIAIAGNPELGDTNIGYNISGDTLVIWNEVAPYYFNQTSGIQFTNNYDEYWTKNIFCGGWKNASDDWEYICNDEYNFTSTIQSDNETYVNYTLSKNATINNRNITLGVVYSLQNNDSNMTIDFSVKNNDAIDISTDLGFAWRVTDINIGADQENNNIKAPTQVYHLDEFQNQSITNAGYYNIYNANNGKYLYLDWDEDLTEVLKIENKTGQYNAPVTLGINIGTLNAGQTKSTTMYWYDAVDYIASNVTDQPDMRSDIVLSVHVPQQVCNYAFIGGVSIDKADATMSTITVDIGGTTFGLSNIGANDSSDGEIRGELWNFTSQTCLDAGTYNFTGTYTGSSRDESNLGIMVIEDVDHVNLSTILSSQSPEASSSSITFDVPIGQMAVDVMAVDVDPPATAAGDNTRRLAHDEGADTIAMSTGPYTDGTTDMAWDTFNDEYVQIGVVLVPYTAIPTIYNESVNTNISYTDDFFCASATIIIGGNDNLDTAYAEIWNTTNHVNYSMTQGGDCGGTGSIWSAKVEPSIQGTWNFSKVWVNDTEGSFNSSDFTDINVTVITANYVLNITAPLTGAQAGVIDGDNITINFTYKRNDVALTSSVSMNNITVGGEYCAFTDIVVEGEEWTQFRAHLNNTGYTTNTAPTNISIEYANFSTVGELSIRSSPAVANGYVYVGSADNYVYQLNASNITKQIANFTTESDVDSSPAIANGYIYIGGYDSHIYQLNATNISKHIANFSTISGITYASPAVANGYVYVGGLENILFQLNATNININIANFSTGGAISSSPAVSNEYIYIGSNNDILHQLNASDISINYYNFTTVGNIQSTPTISNGYVYVVGGNVVGNSFVYQLNASNISIMYANYSLPANSNPANSIAIAHGYIYVGDENTLYQLNASNTSIHHYNYTGTDQFRSSPAVTDGYIYIGGYDNKTYQLDALNIGNEIAIFTTGGTVHSSPAIANGYLYIGGTDGTIRQLGTGGTQTSLEYDDTNNNWKVNCTVPTGFSGLQDLSINASWSTDTSTDTESNAISYGIVDEIYPIFSSYWDSNASLIDSGTGIFNVTVANTNGTVYLEIQATNISANNLTADMYNASDTFASGGTYTYRWVAFGNGTSNNINVSDTFNYVVNSSSSCIYGGSGNWNIDCSDDCTITSDVTVDGSNIYMTGTGTFTINDGVRIEGWGYRKVVRTCYVHSYGTGNFYN